MKKIKSTLFLALVLSITATVTLADDGQIPIGGRTARKPEKANALVITAASESKKEIPSDISNYLWTLVNIIKQFKF